MLEEISIANLGVIKKAKLPFSKGLTVITGETGAGKTMVLSALHMLLGRRVDVSTIRHNEAFTAVEGCWSVKDLNILPQILETGAIVEDDQLFINRTIQDTGKSRAVIGGKTTPAGVLANVGAGLVNIHGQSDQIRLKSSTAQRESLDKFAGKKLLTAVKNYREAYEEWKRLVAHVRDVKNNSESRQREYRDLSKFVRTFDSLTPTPGEDVELEKKIATLSNVEKIRDGVREAFSALSPNDDYDTPSIASQLSVVVNALSTIAEYSKDIEDAAAKAEAISDSVDELTAILESSQDELDADVLQELYESQDRLIEINNLIRHYGASLDDVIEKRETVDERLEELDPETNDISELEDSLKAALTLMEEKAAKVTELRKDAAKKLEAQVNKELAGLAMAGSKLSVDVLEASPSTHGCDEIAFSLKTSGSTVARPIGKAASGGELSRIMLALEVVLADPKETPTFVFDEVDSGVGGATAIEIGKRLALLAQEAQVIVVTHLPQVACFSDSHLYVVKSSTDEYIETNVKDLNKQEQLEELTRMFSGMSSSESGQAHAGELLAQANAYKDNLKR